MDPQQRFFLDMGMSKKKLKTTESKKTLRGVPFPSRKMVQNEHFYKILYFFFLAQSRTSGEALSVI